MNDDPATTFLPKPSRAWIFQANPKIYDLNEALKHLTENYWSVRQYRDEIRSGDRVYLWVSGNDGEIVAVGRTLTDPADIDEPQEERKFYSDPEQVVREPRVVIRVEAKLTRSISRSALSRHPVLSGTSILKAPQATNFKLTEKEARALELLCRPAPSFRDIVERYRQEGTVFQSSERAALYCITSVDDSACEITRLTANEPDRCSLGGYDRKLGMVRDNGGRFPFLNLDATAAKRSTYLQGIELGLTPDGKDVLDLGDEDRALENFTHLLASLNVDRSSGQPKLYKPAMMACVLEAVLDGDLLENRVGFDWILDRFLEKLRAVGQEGGPQQAAYAFFSLTSELFWMLCYHEPSRFIPNASDSSPSSLRERVRHAVIKETYWRLFTDIDRCKTLLKSLGDEWWPRTQVIATDDPLPHAFRAFRSDPACRLHVKVRRTRESQIRELIRHPETVSLEQFHRDIWNGETSAVLDGQEIRGQLIGQVTLEPERLEAVERALDEGRLELHGNFV
jgi:predicted RNA-binding protein with PUA-like domain